jgi:hypothetical protein
MIGSRAKRPIDLLPFAHNFALLFPLTFDKSGTEGSIVGKAKPKGLANLTRHFLLFAFTLTVCGRLCAQMPFYTDDSGVTEPGKVHFEFFNEYDGLQLQYPNNRQNTANFKVNFGLPRDLEVDLDSPYIAIYRADGSHPSSGIGDTNVGIKKRFRTESSTSKLPSFAASFYVEFPTGDSNQQLGSGLTDYWLNLIAQKSISPKTRITGNLGYLFAGNTSTGALGSTGGHVVPAGLSLQRDFLPSLTLGVELFGAYSANGNLPKSQLQGMAGGRYEVRRGLSISFGLLGGKYVASPRVGGQIGFALDFPDVVYSSSE